MGARELQPGGPHHASTPARGRRPGRANPKVSGIDGRLRVQTARRRCLQRIPATAPLIRASAGRAHGGGCRHHGAAQPGRVAERPRRAVARTAPTAMILYRMIVMRISTLPQPLPAREWSSRFASVGHRHVRVPLQTVVAHQGRRVLRRRAQHLACLGRASSGSVAPRAGAGSQESRDDHAMNPSHKPLPSGEGVGAG